MIKPEELRTKEDHFRQIQELFGVKCEQIARFLDVSVDLMCISTDEGQFVTINKAWEDQLGYTSEELEGKYARDFIHPDDIQRTEEHFQLSPPVSDNVLCEGLINRYRTKWGDYRYLEWRSHLVGSMLYSSARDITELHRSEASFRTLFQSAPIPLLIHDIDTGEVLDLNEAAAKTYGISKPEEFMQRIDWHEPPYSLENALAWIKKAAAEGPQKCEWRYRGLSGEDFWSIITLAPIYIGDRRRIMNAIVDISEIKQAETKNIKTLRQLEFANRKQRVMIDISAMFIGAIINNFSDVVNSSLAMIGKILEADRVYIFFYDLKAGIAINEFEWCNEGIIPQIDNLQSTPLEDTQEWVDSHLRGETIFVPSVRALRLQDNTRPILEKQGIKSLLLVPLNFEDLFRGFVGIDSVKKELSFTKEDEKLLKEYGNAFVSTKYRVITQEKLAQSEEFLKSTLFSIGDGVISTDSDGKITMMNQVAEKLTGYSESEAIGLGFDVVFSVHNEISGEKTPNIAGQVISTGERVESEEHTVLKSRDGRRIEIEENAAPIIGANGKVAGAVVVFRDCSEKKEKQRIEYLSMRDHLTGLYNRRYIDKILPAMDSSDNYPLTIMYGDINGLKLTNDVFGHQAGDRLIARVSDILRKSTRSADIIGRIGGDEFVIIIPCADEKKASLIKERIQKMAEGDLLDNIVVSVAIGFATKPDENYTIGEILKTAEENMYRDKLHLGKIMRSRTLDAIIRDMNEKYDYEQIHSARVAQIAEALARNLGLSEKEITDLSVAAKLHDIGKIVISPELLNKPGKLTQSEFEIVKQHSEAGYNILKAVFENAAVSEAVLYHHERWDGTGYPQGLFGDEIPQASRFISIAGAFAAMTGGRPYQPAKTIKDAVDEIKRCSGTQFAPEVAASLVELFEENKLTLLPAVVQ